VGTSPIGVAITPDGTKAYVANQGSASVSVITTSGNTVTATPAVGTNPGAVAVTPDGSTLYVANSGSGTISPITTSNNAVGTAFAAGAGPTGMAFTPDQSPTAALAQPAAGTVWTPVSFNATGSSDTQSPIVSYTWNFGDGTGPSTTGVATNTHVYTTDGSYTASVTVTDAIGTTNTRVFTGQTVSRNGGAAAQATRLVTISTPLGWQTVPGALNFSGSVTGAPQVLSSTLPLDITNGAASGWSISATSTTWTTGGGSPHTLPLTATSISGAPTVACDVVSACALATNAITYPPYVLPAGTTAPTATKLFNAAATTGTGNQTVTPTLKLSVPANMFAGTYTSTVTLTLSSGP
jgi:YVTN family beta-propeller protein